MVSGSSKIVLIEGPNLNFISKRPKIYQSKQNLNTIIESISKFVNIEYYQSNTEGDIINKLQEIMLDTSIIGIIINPAAYSHYSLAISDTLEMISDKIKVEVHLSNIFNREKERHRLITAKNVDSVISGMGSYGYYIAARYITDSLQLS